MDEQDDRFSGSDDADITIFHTPDESDTPKNKYPPDRMRRFAWKLNDIVYTNGPQTGKPLLSSEQAAVALKNLKELTENHQDNQLSKEKNLPMNAEPSAEPSRNEDIRKKPKIFIHFHRKK